jgi:hypothetical protein
MTDKGIILDLEVMGIQDALSKLDVNEYFKVVKRSLSLAMTVVEREAKKETPVDTGALRQGYRTKYPISAR